MSANAPAGIPSNRTGKLAAVCIRAIGRGDAVSVVISHVPAVSCIQLPVSEMMDAITRFRKSGRRRGDHTEIGLVFGCGVASVISSGRRGRIYRKRNALRLAQTCRGPGGLAGRLRYTKHQLEIQQGLPFSCLAP
jgi:hypothetical protein